MSRTVAAEVPVREDTAVFGRVGGVVADVMASVSVGNVRSVISALSTAACWPH